MTSVSTVGLSSVSEDFPKKNKYWYIGGSEKTPGNQTGVDKFCVNLCK